MKINREAIIARLDASFEALEKNIELPAYVRAALPLIKGQLPELLDDEQKRQEIISFLQLVAWAIGYKVTYTEDESIMQGMGDWGD